MGAAKRRRKARQRIRKLKHGMSCDFAVIDPKGIIQRGIAHVLLYKDHQQHSAVKKMISHPNTIPGVVVSGSIKKGKNKSGMWFVSFDKSICAKIGRGSINVTSFQSATFDLHDYRCLEPALIAHAMTKFSHLFT
jgi:hypothetical protein